MTIKDYIIEKAKTSKALRFVFNHAAHLTCATYVSGDLVEMTKTGLHADLSSLSGLLLLGGSMELWTADKHPNVIKVAGGLTIGGATVLAASYIGLEGCIPQILGTMPLIAQGALMMAHRNPVSKAKTNTTYAFGSASKFVHEFPVLSGAFLGATGEPFLMVAAITQGDIGQIITAADWFMGDLSMGLTDPNVRDEMNHKLQWEPIQAANDAKP